MVATLFHLAAHLKACYTGATLLPKLTQFALDRPKSVIVLACLVTLLFGLALPQATIDTDPENMLEATQPDRQHYNEVKERFRINDIITVGIFDERDILRPESLEALQKVIAQLLRIKGVVIQDVASFTTSYNTVAEGERQVSIRPVVPAVPKTDGELAALRKDIRASWPLVGNLITAKDDRGTAIYLPIERKDMSYRIAREAETILQAKLLPGQSFHIAGLPIAEDEFGYQMFVQMGVVAPLAFALILLLVYLLFRRGPFLIPLGLDSMFAVVWSMGLLVATGNTVHIMSSMIPVFLMPIALLDDIHILSEVFDRYGVVRDKRKAVIEAMQPLYRPMLQTSVTTAVGFASLGLTDIPPVRVFGIFVAFGIMAAWLLSITVVPAVLSLMSDEKFAAEYRQHQGKTSLLDRFLHWCGETAFRRSKFILVLALVAVGVSVLGIQRIVINDNPVKWFKESHRIRVADSVMNERFGGTYMAYLIGTGSREDHFTEPQTVKYLDRLQQHLERSPVVGKAISPADIAKVINLRLHANDPAYKKIPDSTEAITQFYFMFESGGDPHDLEMCLDENWSSAVISIRMNSGDNEDMETLEEHAAAFIAQSPPPDGVSFRWSGLTYINKVWQGLMVQGMLKAVLGSFLIVFILLLIEFRSLALGIIAMLPLALAILVAYGLVGWSGKEYDMPIAVCSTLALGLGIDFAIHYIARWRAHLLDSKDLEKTHRYMMGEPGRAILRNAIVITLGFLPLTASNLTPYVTVGVFFALLMLLSTLATMFLLPAALSLGGKRLAGA